MIDLVYLHKIREEVRRQQNLRVQPPTPHSSHRDFLAIDSPRLQPTDHDVRETEAVPPAV
jgi:hypothetical protein